jgi:predicted amidohydrolase
MRVAFFQFAPRFGRIGDNLETVLARLEKVEADLIVLPELFSTGYQFVSKRETAELSEEIPSGRTARRLSEWARDRGIWLVAGMAERKGKALYNSALHVGPKGYAGTYRKVHLFDEEKKWFRPGNLGFPVFPVGKVRLGIMICFDWFFPEAARSLALGGAEVIAHPANLVLPYCPDAMVTRCLENRVFAVTANRIGSEKRGGRKRLTYIGQSEIVDPKGRILTRAPGNKEILKIVEIDPMEARKKKLNRFNDLLRDRRVKLYKTGRK